MSRKIGVLAIQGSFYEHVKAFEALKEDIEVVQVRSASQLTHDLQGLVIPGGESTTIGHFLRKDNFLEKIKGWLNSPHDLKYAWGTCAGLILLADELHNEKAGGQCKIGGIAINAFRNSYGRQKESCEQVVILKNDQLRNCIGGNGNGLFQGVFIRAPKIMEILDNSNTKILAETESAEIVAVWQDNLMATSFHPELTDDLRFHKFFADLLLR